MGLGPTSGGASQEKAHKTRKRPLENQDAVATVEEGGYRSVFVSIIVGILGLALLMVIHEGGHLLAARAFGMRVVRFSIGFGPAIWRHQPKGSDTVYQVALIPFLAYVQIAGMNPFEEIDPADKASYANASLTARTSAIFAGPLANYLFASVLFLGAFMLGGEPTRIHVIDGGAAERAGVQDDDKILRIGSKTIEKWDDIPSAVKPNPGVPLAFEVQRDGKPVTLTVTPNEAPGIKPVIALAYQRLGTQLKRQGEKVRLSQPKKSKEVGGFIGVRPASMVPKMTFKEAAIESVTHPAKVVQALVITLGRLITLKEKPQVSGPVGIVKDTGAAAERGIADYLYWLGLLSAYLGGFNLLPFPALDGGRLMFLGYEAVTRQRANAKVEAHIHAIGLLMFLALIAVITVFDVRKF